MGFTPQQAGLSSVAERVLETPDGERVIAWYARGLGRDGRPSSIFTAMPGSLETRNERIKKYMARAGSACS